MSYMDPFEEAARAKRGVAEGVAWLRDCLSADKSSEEKLDALEGAIDHLTTASSALEDYATHMVDVPQERWGLQDHDNKRVHGVTPAERQLRDPSCAPQAEMGSKLWRLVCELTTALESKALPQQLASFECSLAELPDKLEAAYKAVALVTEDEVGIDGPDEPPGMY